MSAEEPPPEGAGDPSATALAVHFGYHRRWQRIQAHTFSDFTSLCAPLSRDLGQSFSMCGNSRLRHGMIYHTLLSTPGSQRDMIFA